MLKNNALYKSCALFALILVIPYTYMKNVKFFVDDFQFSQAFQNLYFGRSF